MPERTAPESAADNSYAGHAGRMLWPRNANDLTDTTLCPACHARLPSAVCPACGLDLRHPAAVTLLAASTDAAAALDRRAALVGRIRFDTAHAPAAAKPARAEAAPEQAQAPAPSTEPEAEAVPEPAREPEPPARPQPAAHPPRRKRSSVQILLLLVGVSLVSVAAIFFLTVAWLFAGLEMRSAIVGLFTAAALVTAAVLSRRGLAATAEGIGALAVVLVLLDAWALRANNLFGLSATDETLYWGVALLGCAALFFGAHALSRLRVASVAGFALAAPGLGLLVAGLAAGQTDTTQTFLVFLGTAVGTLIHRFTLPRDSTLWPSIDRVPERMILLALGALSLVGAFLTAFFVAPDRVQAPLWTLGAVALVAALHVAQIVAGQNPGRAALLFARGGASLAALTATLIAPTVALRAEDTALSLTAPILSAVALALALELALRRLPVGPASTAATWAAVTAAAMAAGSAVFVVGWASVPLADAVVSGLTRAGNPVATAEPESAWALGALAAVGGLAALFWALGGILRARRHLVAWLALVVIVLAVPFAGSLWLVLTAYLLLGALALAALLLTGQEGWPALGQYRPVVIALLVAAEASGYLVSWASSDSWWIGTISAVLVVFVARLLPDRTGGATARGALLAGAIVLALVGAGAAPWALTLGLDPSATALLVNMVRGLTLATAGFQVAVALAWRGAALTETERRWAFWTLLGPTVLAFAVPIATYVDGLPPAERDTLLQPEPAAGIAHAALLLAAPLLWVLARGNQAALHRERFVAAIALAPAFLLLVWNIIRATDAPAPVESIAVPAVALVVCAIGLAVGTLRAGVRERLGLEIGAAIILVPAVSEATGPDRPLGWLTLVLAGVAALIVAIAPDGLFASHSPRRHFGWLALALGTAGLWLGLSRAGEDALEPYVLPVAAVLLVLAALIRRFGRVDRTVTASPVAALLTLAGLSVAIVPLALAGQTGSLARPIIVGTVSAVLLLGASAIRWTPPWSAYLAAVGLAGAAGVFLTAAGRAGRALAQPGGPDGRLEAWLLPAALVFVVAGTLTVVAARRRDAALALPSVAARTRFGYGLVIAAILCVLLAEVLALDFTPLAAIRVILLAWTFSALHLAAFWLDPSPLGRLVSWVAIGSGGAIVLAGYTHSAPDPIEIVSVPLAVALLTSGRLHLDATRSARSWPWLAPGLLVLLVPSLLLDVTESPLWRVVGLGILAIVVVVVGAARKLQAPFVIGAVVLVIHALAQLWPWIALAYGSAPWWLWLGIGGVILIILAARYEQRIKNLRSVALTISALR